MRAAAPLPHLPIIGLYLQAHIDVILRCEFHRNRVFTGGVDGIVFLWDIRSGRPGHELTGHTVRARLPIALLISVTRVAGC